MCVIHPFIHFLRTPFLLAELPLVSPVSPYRRYYNQPRDLISALFALILFARRKNKYFHCFNMFYLKVSI